MHIMPTMRDYIHEIRREELRLVWQVLDSRRFDTGLELGAGDGWSSSRLTDRISHLISSDIHPAILERSANDHVTYEILDAEKVAAVHASASFDVVLSSNLLEHLPDPVESLRAMLLVTKPSGVAIHIMPSPFWKINQMSFFLASQFLRRVERYCSGDLPSWLRRSVKTRQGVRSSAALPPCNNPKSAPKRRNPLARRLVPPCHGVSSGHLEEFRAFRRSHWTACFREAGYEIDMVVKGPWTSGYGFGCGRLRTTLRNCMPACEHMIVAHRPA